ncbi:T9SS type A sorting domain-containing protein [Flavobacterium sp. WW92]|uniref:T9SS type A sorting domain-containing protein n=1 Tax=unclassified Flavobacterium TaxID=196869 RepID=UPI002225645B|nr:MULTISPECIES: T9SS type A sorting domain-containing protein [unclassified Flavobacterium]WDO12495.1 T9SS type A sorting domain-containing protein [Flavobacterium sp. WW92]
MKKITLWTAGLLFVFSSAYSQKELWGYRMTSIGMPGSNDGQIIKTPLIGTDTEPETVYSFDPTGLTGRYPRGKLFQASSGKLYGVTSYETTVPAPGVPSGVLFEYDLTTDRYKLLYSGLVNAMHAVIEPLPGVLYGVTNGGSSVFKYVIDSEQFSIVATLPPFTYNGSNQYPKLIAGMMKASDGNLYGVTSMAPSTQNIPYPGGIYRLNLATGQLVKVYVFGVGGSDIMYPMYESGLVEGAAGKLYGTALGGAHIGPQGVAPLGSGTLYEFTIAGATMSKKFDFDYAVNGANPSPLAKSADNKLYGTLGGNNNSALANADGLVFEYDLATGSLSMPHIFSYVADDLVRSPYGAVLKGSDNAIYGNSPQGTFKLDLTNNTVIRKMITSNMSELKDLIEICRKPSYRFFDTASFIVCQNNPFVFDVHNTNAASYVWRKGSTVLPLQTTGILNIASLTLADSGIYTCTMTNACGTTVTMPLQLTVDGCLGLDEAIGLKNAIKLYPNPAANVLNLKLPEAADFAIQHISITNMLGQLVYSGAYNSPAIEISFLKTGLYQLLLTTDKGDWNGKFVKE